MGRPGGRVGRKIKGGGHPPGLSHSRGTPRARPRVRPQPPTTFAGPGNRPPAFRREERERTTRIETEDEGGRGGSFLAWMNKALHTISHAHLLHLDATPHQAEFEQRVSSGQDGGPAPATLVPRFGLQARGKRLQDLKFRQFCLGAGVRGLGGAAPGRSGGGWARERVQWKFHESFRGWGPVSPRPAAPTRRLSAPKWAKV